MEPDEYRLSHQHLTADNLNEQDHLITLHLDPVTLSLIAVGDRRWCPVRIEAVAVFCITSA